MKNFDSNPKDLNSNPKDDKFKQQPQRFKNSNPPIFFHRLRIFVGTGAEKVMANHHHPPLVGGHRTYFICYDPSSRVRKRGHVLRKIDQVEDVKIFCQE